MRGGVIAAAECSRIEPSEVIQIDAKAPEEQAEASGEVFVGFR